MKTYYITFHTNDPKCPEFTDESEGNTIKQAVERLGLTIGDVAEYVATQNVTLKKNQ